MSKAYPKSLLFFLATAFVVALQLVPGIGVILIFMLAMFWSVALVNLGMVGIAVEALSGSVPRRWLALPIVFYGGYWTVATMDQLAVHRLRASYGSANAQAVAFEPARQQIVFNDDHETADWFVQNYDLPVAFSRSTEGVRSDRSHRLLQNADCKTIAEDLELRGAFFDRHGFHDEDDRRPEHRTLEKRFCDLILHEKPTLPTVIVSRQKTRRIELTLPVEIEATTVTTPGGKAYQLFGGTASPLRWFPMPVMGCWTKCGAALLRSPYVPIVSEGQSAEPDNAVLAQVLGLRRVSPVERRGVDVELVREIAKAIASGALARDLAHLDTIIAELPIKVDNWQLEALWARPHVLDSRAEAIMRAIEVAEMTGRSESGRILVNLLLTIDADRIQRFGPRLLALFANADDKSWLWETDILIRRLGDFGPKALPYLLNPRYANPSAFGPNVEGLCRVGLQAREEASARLMAIWQDKRLFGSNDIETLYVALRRMGIKPTKWSTDPSGSLYRFEKEWSDVSPQSPPSVCDIGKEKIRRSTLRAGG